MDIPLEDEEDSSDEEYYPEEDEEDETAEEVYKSHSVITFPGNFHCIKRVIPENNLNAINCISVTHRLSSRVTWIAFRLHHV